MIFLILVRGIILIIISTSTIVERVSVLVFSIMYEPMNGENNPPRIVNILYKLTLSVVFLSSIILRPYVCLPSQ